MDVVSPTNVRISSRIQRNPVPVVRGIARPRYVLKDQAVPGEVQLQDKRVSTAPRALDCSALRTGKVPRGRRTRHIGKSVPIHAIPYAGRRTIRPHTCSKPVYCQTGSACHEGIRSPGIEILFGWRSEIVGFGESSNVCRPCRVHCQCGGCVETPSRPERAVESTGR